VANRNGRAIAIATGCPRSGMAVFGGQLIPAGEPRPIFDIPPRCSPWPHSGGCFLLAWWGLFKLRSAFGQAGKDKAWQHPGL